MKRIQRIGPLRDGVFAVLLGAYVGLPFDIEIEFFIKRRTRRL